MYKIFLVEDDYSLANAMKKQIEDYGNEVKTVCDFKNIVGEFAEYNPQLVLMDIMLPSRNGYYWCSEIRKISSVPIIFISSASENLNIVMAVNMGGDDFIPKPVDPMVLTAKIQAVLRRTYEIGGSQQIIQFCGALLNLSDSSVTNGENKAELTKNELRILQTLVESKGKTVTRDVLMMRLWQSDIYVEENTLTVNVGRLRKKLDEIGLCDVIETKSGVGYIIK